MTTARLSPPPVDYTRRICRLSTRHNRSVRMRIPPAFQLLTTVCRTVRNLFRTARYAFNRSEHSRIGDDALSVYVLFAVGRRLGHPAKARRARCSGQLVGVVPLLAAATCRSHLEISWGICPDDDRFRHQSRRGFGTRLSPGSAPASTEKSHTHFATNRDALKGSAVTGHSLSGGLLN